ncbi:MAG: CYTH domain-containing protein [Elusimicrobiota bacterium]|nr:MAG: CYTH domain-containing protein [Elusimicrobiota bacterium]
MKRRFENFARSLMKRLEIDDLRFVEIESKKRVDPDEASEVKDWLLDYKGMKHAKTNLFYDQFLDTPSFEVLKAGASLRLRYKKNGTAVYLQYKGPGFHRDGLLYRSEFSSDRLDRLVQDESHHDIVRFNEESLASILKRNVGVEMRRALDRHLGPAVVKRITCGPILALYQKDKYELDLGSAFLEPSLDRVSAFHIAKKGLHSLSTFCEFENEIKAGDGSLRAKLEHMDELLEFNEEIEDEFELRREPLDKYHRCASFFVK